MNQHFLLGDVAKILGQRPHRIAYMITTGQVPEPEVRVANKRLFAVRDVMRLARLLRAEPDWSAVGRESPPIESREAEVLAITPPFEVSPAGGAGHEIRDGNGEIFSWARDRARALVVAGLLESAARG